MLQEVLRHGIIELVLEIIELEIIKTPVNEKKNNVTELSIKLLIL